MFHFFSPLAPTSLLLLLLSLFFVVVIDRHFISFSVYCVFNWDNVMHLLSNDFHHIGPKKRKNRFEQRNFIAKLLQHCNLLVSICSLNSRSKLWKFTFIISPIKYAHSFIYCSRIESFCLIFFAIVCDFLISHNDQCIKCKPKFNEHERNVVFTFCHYYTYIHSFFNTYT